MQYYLEIDTRNPMLGHIPFRAENDELAILGAQRIAAGKNIMCLYTEEADGSMRILIENPSVYA